MREIRTSSLMSGDGRRTAHAAPRPSSTLQGWEADRQLRMRNAEWLTPTLIEATLIEVTLIEATLVRMTHRLRRFANVR